MNETIQSIETELKTIKLQLRFMAYLMDFKALNLDTTNNQDFIIRYNELVSEINKKLSNEPIESPIDIFTSYDEYKQLISFFSNKAINPSEDAKKVYEQIMNDLKKHYQVVLNSLERLKIYINNLQDITKA